MKKLVSVLLTIVMVCTLAACGSSGGSADTNSPAADTANASGSDKDWEGTLRIGDTWGASHPMAAAIDNVFKKEVEEKTGGKIKVDVKHDGLLGNEVDLWTSVRDGSIQSAVVGSCMNQEFTMMLISDWPFLYRDIEHAKKVWTDSEVLTYMNDEFNKKFPEVEIVGWGPNSARTFTSNKPLTSVDEFKGQLFRIPSNPIHEGIAENLGASYTVIALGELYTALETGTVDGQENGMVTVIAQNFDKVQKYLYETNHIVATLEFILNKDFLDGLSESQRKIVTEAGERACEQAWTDYIASIDADRETLIAAGVTVTPCTAEDQAQIIEKIQPLIDKLYAQNDWAPNLTEMVKNVK